MLSNDQVLVSVVMNCFNSDTYLKEAVQSLIDQTYQNWELIFWDNQSTDNSASIVKSFGDKRVRYFYSKEHTPLGEARNLALKEVTGKYVAFLDCDDVYFPDKLQRQVSLMEESDYVMCYGSVVTIDSYGNKIRDIQVRNQSGNLFGALLEHYEINMQTVMVRNSFLIDNGLSFSPFFKYCPDHNLFMEIASSNPVGVVQEYIVKYRILDNSLSKKTIDIAPSEIKYTLDKISCNVELSVKYRKEFESAYNKVHYYIAVSAIYKNDRRQARIEIRKVLFSRKEYFALYLLLLIPIPNQWMLWVLRR